MKKSLYRQLIAIAVIICGIVFISLGLLLPKLLFPIYEKNIYLYLQQPLELIENEIKNPTFDDIAYLYVTDNKEIIISENLEKIIALKPKQILDKINKESGKFTYLGKVYYYYSTNSEFVSKVALTSSNYILNIRKDVFNTLLPILIITLLLTSGLILLWARRLVVKIGKLKEKIENFNNDEYKCDDEYTIDDELSALSNALDNMKESVKRQEEYKNQMYQNISHDFKTPITVIKTHLEAIDDNIIPKEEGFSIIKEQINKLEIKVHSLLYLNKLLYLEDEKIAQNSKVDITEILKSSFKKFQIQRPDVNFSIKITGKAIFSGNADMWEAIIDNILNNFVRYAEKEIKINLRNNKITLYNDGPNIDDNVLDDLFTPYKKGIKGQFGLGLSIVKKTLNLLGYSISVKNEKKGVNFIIK